MGPWGSADASMALQVPPWEKEDEPIVKEAGLQQVNVHWEDKVACRYGTRGCFVSLVSPQSVSSEAG